MSDAARFRPEETQPMVDPTTGSGNVWLFPNGFGQAGHPFVLLVEDPPHKTRARHHHHGDVIYFYVRGEHRIEGEGVYRAGDVRWTRGGHAYGPETTGPDGGAWWIVSFQDPIPIEDGAAVVAGAVAAQSEALGADELTKFRRPYDWKAIDEAVRQQGAAIITAFLTPAQLDRLDTDIDAHLAQNPGAGTPASGSSFYDLFLGKGTVRLHGLAEKIGSAAELIADEELVSFAERLIGPGASSVLLNAGELIQIGAKEPAQFLHRDTDSWPALPIGRDPVLVNAIVALDPFTFTNGATYLAPQSWRWDRHRQPKRDELRRALMDRGDAVLFRGDIMHGGGENVSNGPRRGISISYCAGWLRTVENSFLNVRLETVKRLPERLQDLLGYRAHDATSQRGGLLGLYENADPHAALADPRP